MLSISHSFNHITNTDSIRFEEVDEILSENRDGPVSNGIGPREVQTVINSSQALSTIKNYVGNSMRNWTLGWVMPKDGQPSFYKLFGRHFSKPTFLPSDVVGLPRYPDKSLNGADVQPICGMRGGMIFDAGVDL